MKILARRHNGLSPNVLCLFACDLRCRAIGLVTAIVVAVGGAGATGAVSMCNQGLNGARINTQFRLVVSSAVSPGDPGTPADMDFGDAPEPYPTLLANDGARHRIVFGVYLGSQIEADAERDGLPDREALGDDRDNVDDEDGVAFHGPLVPGLLATAEVIASTNGFLNGWIDFQGDGSWGEPVDHVFTNQPLSPGPNALSFLIPSHAAVQLSGLARFRFCTEPAGRDWNFTGLAPDGEVEDYRVEIVDSRALEPVLTSITRERGAVRAAWTARPGGIYRLQYKSELGGKVTWKDAPGNLLARDRITSQSHFPLKEASYYRVALEELVLLDQSYLPAPLVRVLPVFFVPQDAPDPTEAQMQTLMDHLTWAQARYEEMLEFEGTFSLVNEPLVYHASYDLDSEYYKSPQNGAPQYVCELLQDLGYSRFNCPYVFVIVVMNPPNNPWPPLGGGRPINGGHNTGGGLVQVSSTSLDSTPNFQSTLQHELGHAFGLNHVSAYGYDMETSPSIMSYNTNHHTYFFNPSPTPGELIPEDVRALAANERVFPLLTFDPPGDVRLAPWAFLGPMDLENLVSPGITQVPYEITAAPVPPSLDENAQHIVLGRIKPRSAPFDASSMWRPLESLYEDGWVTVRLTFPLPVKFSPILVHSGHSSTSERVQAVKIDSQEQDVASADQYVYLDSPSPKEEWEIAFKAGESDTLVVRGLRFFDAGREICVPMVNE